tara:strand:+ start:1286 stop:1492 length:207 start_codon:yes stop_codon:yes gene_type:complete
MNNIIDFSKININSKEFSKIIFIYNALEDGWSIKKSNNKYIFSKHKTKEKQIISENFLNIFITKYFKI